jgi:hypothetical protein
MNDQEKRIDDMKERMLLSFLRALDDIAFVKRTDSVTDEVEHYPPAVTDMEATIRISGEFDREDLKNLIVSRAG